MNTSGPSYPLASLYVGDLHQEVTEAMLFEKFTAAGSVLSIRVCRDMMTRKSLGYAYVNFQHPQDAERAMETMNYDSLKGRPIRIMWSQRDPSLRRSGFGNIFIKNLDKSIDNKSMYDTFSGFGPILSCKVAQDEHGNSRGYAFVHFETEAAANSAIEKVNGMLLNGKKVFVGRFVPRTERERNQGDQPRKFTNVFVKNFDQELDDDKMQKMFEKFGTISSHRVMVDDTGKSRGFGFVSFEDAESAEKAVAEMNGFDLNGRSLYVGRAQKKAEREQELRRRFEARRRENQNRFAGVNLYVKNLDENLTDEQLKAEFAKYGEINSAKIMRENGRSKGFGFVCFTTPEEATKAVAEMNGKHLVGKPLYVAMAQRKEDRRVVMAAQMMQRFVPQQFRPNAQAAAAMYAAGPMPGMPFMYPGMQAQGPRGFFPSAAQMGQLGGQMIPGRGPRPWNPMGQRGPNAQGFVPRMQGGGQPYRQPGGGPQGMRSMAPGGPRAAMQQAGVNMGAVQQQQQPRMQGANMMGPGVRQPSGMPPTQQGQPAAGMRTSAQTFAVRAPGQPMVSQQPQRGPATQQSPGGIDPSALAQASAQEQKQMLGERLYPIIQKHCGELAGKVTGMLLEIDNAELLLLLENQEQLKNKMEEAVNVLKRHMKSAPTTMPNVEGGDGSKQEPGK